MSDDPRVGARPPWRVSRELRPEGTVVDLGGGVLLGGPEVAVMAGPCAVEGRTQMLEIAEAVRAAGATVLRGGAFKPRTSPYSFQGLGVRGLELLAEARAATGMPVVTEAVDTESVPPVAEYADMIQVGARNMQNFGLLRRVGRTGKPVLLKRGMGATIDELLLAAEYFLAEGSEAVALCERGVRGFDPAALHVFDLNAIPLLRSLTHLPLIADPSHGTGVRAHVAPMARAAVAAGADGIIVEVHTNPSEARSDGAQSIDPGQLRELVSECGAVARAVGRSLAPPRPAPAAVAGRERRSAMSGRQSVGRRGEELAAAYLVERGWRILARNYRAGPKEIDIVAERGGVVAFVEVKTRATATGGTPLEPIRAPKRWAVEAAARRWIHEHGQRGAAYRFDAVAVQLGGGGHDISHIPDAWRP